METVIINTWADYQAAAMRTCTESSGNDLYMQLGLVSEAGEVCGKFAKAIRDDNGKLTDARKKEIIAELGDVMWMLMGKLYVNDINIEHLFECEMQTISSHNIKSECFYLSLDALAMCYVQAILSHAAKLSSFMEGTPANWAIYYSKHIREIIKNVALIADYCGSSLLEVCQRNIDKLTERYNRNTIHGSGDNR